MHLKESKMTKTLISCEATLIEIAGKYLTNAMDYVAKINTANLDSNEMADEPLNKKIKIIESRLNRHEKTFNYSNLYKRHIHTVMSLLDILEIGKKDRPLAMDTCIKWAELTVKYFFWSLIDSDVNVRKVAVERTYLLLARQCSERKYCRVAALRELLEGALFSYANLFGVHLDIESDCDVQKRDDRLLIKMNQMQNNTPNNIRSFLHAGIIGQGKSTMHYIHLKSQYIFFFFDSLRS